MKDLKEFIVDLNDIYGKTIPGIILVVDVYFILLKTTYYMNIIKYTKWLYNDSSILFIILFIILGYLLGNIPLFILFRFISDPIRSSANKIISEIDLTQNEDIALFYKTNFSKEILNKKSNMLSTFCKHSLLGKNDDAFRTLKAIEYASNLKIGLSSSLFVTSVTLSIYEHYTFSIIIILSALVYLWDFKRTILGEDRTAIWLYYIENKDKMSQIR